ncbi:MAG: MBL fold metallo-hydrolase [Lachnospirales bacterium]
MKTNVISVTEMQENSSIIFNEDTKEAFVIDPGDMDGEVLNYVKSNDLNVIAILLTHGHFDHILGVPALKELTNAPIYANINEKEILENAEMNFSKKYTSSIAPKADVYFQNDETLSINGYSIKTQFIGEHTPGSVSYYFEADKSLFSGDTLFNRSIGRTDFHNGNSQVFIKNIKEKQLTLPDDTIIHPGHGASTTVGKEKRVNPYFIH